MRNTSYITALRFPLALLVVLIHAHNSVWQSIEFESSPSLPFYLSHVIPTFAVPLFFAISGYLFFLNTSEFTPSVYIRKINRRKATLFLPYLVWNLIAFGLYALKDLLSGQSLQYPPSLHILWDSHILGESFRNWTGWNIAAATAPVQQPLWFVRDLMVIVLLSPIIYFILNKFRWFGLILFGVVYYAELWPNFGGISFQGMWFFVLGAWFGIRKSDVIESTARLFIPSAVLVAPLSLFLLLFPDASPGIHGTAQALYVLCAMVCAVHLADFGRRISKPYQFLSQSSFFIYASHTIVLLPITTHFAQWAIGKPAILYNLAYLLCPALAVMICLAAFYLLRRFFPGYQFLLTGIYK